MDDYGLCPPLGPAHYAKTPDESILIPFAWAARLDGETISSTSYEFPDGLASAATVESGSLRKVRITGGDDGGQYRVICKVVTSGTRTLEWVKRVSVREG